jgi:hypothetical protein
MAAQSAMENNCRLNQHVFHAIDYEPTYAEEVAPALDMVAVT